MDAEEGGKKKPDLHRRGVFVAVSSWRLVVGGRTRKDLSPLIAENLFLYSSLSPIFLAQYKKLQMSSI